MGGTLGISSILIYNNHADGVQSAGVDIINVNGDNLDAQQLILTLHPPRVIPLSFDDVRAHLDQQNLKGEQTAAEISPCAFPGTDEPIRWPPLEAVVEFGTGGVNTEIVVDYMNGVTLSVPASFLRVHALVTQSRRCGDVYGTSAAYYLAGHVGPGFAASHAQRTIFVGAVHDDHESDALNVPMFGRVAILVGHRSHHGHHPAHTIGWIRFWQSPNGTNGVGDFFISDHQVRVDVPNGAQYFSVFNKSGHEMKMSVLFELAL
jgi:hypothetical protein